MNILYINHYAGSLKHGMEYRPFYMSREWNELGHNVTILAASQSHVRSKQPEMNGIFTEENISNINYVWSKTPKYTSNGLLRFINMLVFVFRIFQYAFKLKNAPEVVIASSTYPLDIFPAQFIAKKFKAKLVFEVHDLWPLSPIELGNMSKFHPFILLIQFAEDYAYKHADIVVSMLPKTLEYMVSRGMNPKKFLYVPNGIDLKEWDLKYDENNLPKEITDLKNEISKLHSEGKFVIAYLGTHGLANALENFIDAAEILKDSSIYFYLIGSGPDKNKLVEFAKNKNIKNVIFVNPIPKNFVPFVTRLFDANYIGLQRQSLFRFGISPNKLMDYMAASKPIINAIEAGNDPVKEANCGLSVEAENPKALAEAIIKLSKMSNEDRLKLGQNGKDFVYREHDYKILAKNFVEGIKS